MLGRTTSWLILWAVRKDTSVRRRCPVCKQRPVPRATIVCAECVRLGVTFINALRECRGQDKLYRS